MLSRAFARRATSAARPVAARRALSTIKPGHETEVRSAFTYAADPAAGDAYVKLLDATVKHSEGTGKLWGKISLFIVIPIIAGTAWHTYLIEKEHFEHLAAHPRLPDEELPAEFDYQNVRNTRYFWGNGDKTLFWNDKYNHRKEE